MEGITDEAQHAISYLATTIFFLENGDIDTVEESELENYFNHCAQVEIYFDKFKKKGFYLTVDDGGCALTTSSSALSNPKYDLGRVADQLMGKFFRPTVPSDQLTTAVNLYNRILGVPRFVKLLQEYSSSKCLLNLGSIVGSAVEEGHDIEAAMHMEVFEAIADGRGGVQRMTDFLREWIVEDECADTVVSVFAVEALYSEFYVEIKNILLGHLRDKFKKKPHERMWLKMVLSLNLIRAVNCYHPFLEFILELMDGLTKNITFDESQGFIAPVGSLTYGNLLIVALKLYRNKKSEQAMKNFIFDRCSLNQDVWLPILKACKSLPEIQRSDKDYVENVYAEKELISPAAVKSVEWKN